jgi:hypothetical protein
MLLRQIQCHKQWMWFFTSRYVEYIYIYIFIHTYIPTLPTHTHIHTHTHTLRRTKRSAASSNHPPPHTAGSAPTSHRSISASSRAKVANLAARTLAFLAVTVRIRGNLAGILSCNSITAQSVKKRITNRRPDGYATAV